MSKILIINTGGTISMVWTENSYAPNLEKFHWIMLPNSRTFTADPERV